VPIFACTADTRDYHKQDTTRLWNSLLMRFGSRKTSGAAASLVPTLYGDAPLSAWPPDESGEEPWASFVEARRLAAAGDTGGASAIWRRIAETEGLEPRHTLQAWHFLGSAGVRPPESVAADVYGVVAQVPVSGGHDLLVAYRDGAARYLNHSGSVAVVEPPAPDGLAAAITAWLAEGSRLSAAIGPWEGPLPDVPKRHARILMLTPSGPRFGQGPFADLSADPMASAFLDAATAVLQNVVALSG
jgi:hypothetical protein